MACVEIIPLSVDGVWRKSWENTSLPYCTLNNSKNPPLERNCFRHVRCWTEKWRRAHFRKFSSHDFRACVGLLWSPRKAENVLNDKVRRCRLVRVGLGDFKSLPISFKNVNFRPFVLMLAGNVNTHARNIEMSKKWLGKKTNKQTNNWWINLFKPNHPRWVVIVSITCNIDSSAGLDTSYSPPTSTIKKI